jgi:hypothetical protein
LIALYIVHLEALPMFSAMKFNIETITKGTDDRSDFVIKGVKRI